MLNIIVYGPGCSRCEEAEKVVRHVIEQMGITAQAVFPKKTRSKDGSRCPQLRQTAKRAAGGEAQLRPKSREVKRNMKLEPYFKGLGL